MDETVEEFTPDLNSGDKSNIFENFEKKYFFFQIFTSICNP